MKLCKAWGTSFSLIPFLRCGCEPWKWPPTAWGCHPDKWGIPVFWFGQPYFLKNDGVSKSREQITSHLFCKIMLATTFHSPSASASYIYVNWDTQALSKGIYLYIYINIYIHTEQEQELISMPHLTGRALKELSASSYCLEGLIEC